MTQPERVTDFVRDHVFEHGVNDALGLFRIHRIAGAHSQQIEREAGFFNRRLAV